METTPRARFAPPIECVVDLYAKTAHRGLDLCVAELAATELPRDCLSSDKSGHFGSVKRVGTRRLGRRAQCSRSNSGRCVHIDTRRYAGVHAIGFENRYPLLLDEGRVPGRSLIAFCQAHDLLRLLAHAGLWGSLRSRRLDAACLRSGLGGSKWCARSMPHSRERSHPRRASRLDAFRRAAGQQCILVLRITPSWPPGRACWWCS